MFQNRNKCFIIRTIFYNEPLTLRELSRLTKCSPSKVSRLLKKYLLAELVFVDVKGRGYLIYPNLKNTLLKYELLQEEAAYTELTFSIYPELVKRLKRIYGKVVIVFGSYAEHNADELSDIDVLTIEGEGDFNLSLVEFRKMLREKNPTVMSILKKHVIIRGFELFIDEVIKWKESLYGVQR